MQAADPGEHHAPLSSVLTPLLAGWVIGTAFQLGQGRQWLPWMYAGVLVAGCASIVLAITTRRAVRLAFLAACALAFALCGLRAHLYLSQSLGDELQGRDIAVTGLVAAMPQMGEDGLRMRLDVESASLAGQPVRLPARVLLAWYAERGGASAMAPPAPPRAGDRWQFTVRLRQPHGASNPHGFDYELWLWEQGYGATGYVRDGDARAPAADQPPPRRLGATWWHPVERARQAVRDAIVARVADARLAGIVAGLVTGDQSAIARADWDVFRATGVAHLMSISGLHITMFAWLAAVVVGALWRRADSLVAPGAGAPGLCLRLPAQNAGLIGGVLLAGGYAVFSGWGVPAQRTVCMLAAVAALRLLGLRWPWPQVWLLACAAVTLADPWALLQPGFWLSFVAVGMLFAAAPSVDAETAGNHAPTRLSRWRAWLLAHLGSAAREQWLVTVALTPLTLLLFGQVSLVGLAANALAIPVVTLLVTPLAMAGLLVPPAWDAAAAVAGLLVGALQWLAGLPGASLWLPAAPGWVSLAAIAGGLVAALRLPVALRLLAGSLMLPALLWQPSRPPDGAFELIAADVGQGNAVLVRTARHTLVYDTGPRYSAEADAGQRVLVPLLHRLGEHVDTVMLSHRDMDHTGGAAAVLAAQPDARLVGSLEDGHPLRSLRASTRCEAGQRWTWDGVAFDVLAPRPADYGAAIKSNGMSCVLRIQASPPVEGNAAGQGLAGHPVAGQGAAALLAGDVEAPQERWLLEWSRTRGGDALRADVLLVPHHGSRTSSTPAFIDAVAPRVALVQAGWRNRFGHPAPQVLERYQARGIRVVDSPSCGAAAWSSTRPLAVQCWRQEARRYWHHRTPVAAAWVPPAPVDEP